MWIFGVHDGTYYSELCAESIIEIERKFYLLKISADLRARTLRKERYSTIRYYHTSQPNKIYSAY